MMKLQRSEDETTRRLRKLGRAFLDRWTSEATSPNYLHDWAARVKAAVSAGELRRLYDGYARRARDQKLPKRHRTENRKRASALRRLLVK